MEKKENSHGRNISSLCDKVESDIAKQPAKKKKGNNDDGDPQAEKKPNWKNKKNKDKDNELGF